MSNDPRLLATAVEAALRAGELQQQGLTRAISVTKKGTIDLVTDVDVAVERMLRALIHDRYPAHAVLGEELQGQDARAPDRGAVRWIMDPIDGTTNYAHGLPFYCVSIAVEVDGDVEVGVVYDPDRRELFTAERGLGARLNGRPLGVSQARSLVDSLLCTGFPYDVQETLEEVISLFAAFVARARAVRRLGSAALDLCYVAAGRLDGFWEQRLHAWDVAAGGLIAAEAGATVTDWAGAPYRVDRHDVLACTPDIHAEMLQIITSHAARRPAAPPS